MVLKEKRFQFLFLGSALVMIGRPTIDILNLIKIIIVETQ